jgi:hypothetical protein
VAGWTALVFACAGAGGGGGGGSGGGAALECARRLLAAGARVDGAPARGDDVCTLTPLQVRIPFLILEVLFNIYI